MTRRVVQITATTGGENNAWDVLYALCDDGSVWMIDRPNGSSNPSDWNLLPKLPFGEVPV